jgi:hypothetical protein
MPMHGRLDALFKGTCALRDAGRSIVNVLVTIKNKNDFENATAALYLRMFGWIDSLTRLNQLVDVQAACSVTRSIYELFIDYLELKNDPTLISRFVDFTFVERYRAAQSLVEVLDETGADKSVSRPQRAFVDNPTHKIKLDAILAKHWTNEKGVPVLPHNWRGRKLHARIKSIGKDEDIRYRTLYPMFSWYTHSGLVGFYDLGRMHIWLHSASRTFTRSVSFRSRLYRLENSFKFSQFQNLSDKSRIISMQPIDN